jgi:hypothetical protein
MLRNEANCAAVERPEPSTMFALTEIAARRSWFTRTCWDARVRRSMVWRTARVNSWAFCHAVRRSKGCMDERWRRHLARADPNPCSLIPFVASRAIAMT